MLFTKLLLTLLSYVFLIGEASGSASKGKIAET